MQSLAAQATRQQRLISTVSLKCPVEVKPSAAVLSSLQHFGGLSLLDTCPMLLLFSHVFLWVYVMKYNSFGGKKCGPDSALHATF